MYFRTVAILLLKCHFLLLTTFVADGFDILSDDTFQVAVNSWFEDNSAALTTYGNITNWDTSRVTSMGSAFARRPAFNADLSKWNVSNVVTMAGMFTDAKAFNADIGKWQVGKVTTMNSLFSLAHVFNSDISKWNTSAVTTMERSKHG